MLSSGPPAEIKGPLAPASGRRYADASHNATTIIPSDLLRLPKVKEIRSILDHLAGKRVNRGCGASWFRADGRRLGHNLGTQLDAQSVAVEGTSADNQDLGAKAGPHCPAVCGPQAPASRPSRLSVAWRMPALSDEAPRTGHKMWDLWREFYSRDLARSTREGQPQTGHNVAIGPRPTTASVRGERPKLGTRVAPGRNSSPSLRLTARRDSSLSADGSE
jgi:hypothetical protein